MTPQQRVQLLTNLLQFLKMGTYSGENALPAAECMRWVSDTLAEATTKLPLDTQVAEVTK